MATAGNVKKINVKPKMLLPVTICYEIGSSVEDSGTGIIKITTYYRCRTFNF